MRKILVLAALAALVSGPALAGQATSSMKGYVAVSAYGSHTGGTVTNSANITAQSKATGNAQAGNGLGYKGAGVAGGLNITGAGGGGGFAGAAFQGGLGTQATGWAN